MLQQSSPSCLPLSLKKSRPRSIRMTAAATVTVTKLQMKGIVTLSVFLLSNAAVATDHPERLAVNTPRASKVADVSSDENDIDGSGSQSGSSCQIDTPTNESNIKCPTGGETTRSAPSTPSAFVSRREVSSYQVEGDNSVVSTMTLNEDEKEDWCPKCLEVCAGIPRGGQGSLQKGGEVLSDLLAAGEAAAKSTNPYGLPLNAWKVIMQAFLTAINVLCWLGPLQSKQISENKLALSLANAFSGGVFLSLAFFHLIPECIHGFDATWPEAAPFGMVLAGYLLIFFVEKVAFDAHDILHEMQHQPHHHHQHSQQLGSGGGEGVSLVDASHNNHGNDENNAETSTATANPEEETATTIRTVVSGGPMIDSGAVASAAATADGSSSSGRSAIILLGALGVHSVLEMMALGLSDTFGDAALLTTSIALHQPAESIALLVAFLKSGMPKPQIIQSLSIFSCMGPLGVALGMAVNAYAAPVVDSIMLAVVAGTFVYVGATEVIPEEWEDSQHKWKKFTALMSGIVMIVAVTQYTATW